MLLLPFACAMRSLGLPNVTSGGLSFMPSPRKQNRPKTQWKRFILLLLFSRLMLYRLEKKIQEKSSL